MVQVASISEQVLPVHIGLKDYKLLRKNVAGLHDYYLEPQRIKLTFLFDISYKKIILDFRSALIFSDIDPHCIV